MDEATYHAVLADESTRFLRVVRGTDPAARVPSCPEWSAADLTWHMAEVQHFWAAVVDGLLEDPDDVGDLERPPDLELPALFEDRSSALQTALARRASDDRCWSWHSDGWTVGWTLRRQAHEALIHRIDAELAARRRVTVADAAVAADGVAELLEVLIAMPAWGDLEPDGATIVVHATDVDTHWTLAFARFVGTSPASGKEYDLEVARVVPGGDRIDATVAGTAWDLDRWLWGRGSDEELVITGDHTLAHRLRAATEIE